MILNNLPYPPSINQYYRSLCIKGRPRILISKKGREYREKIATYVLERRLSAHPSKWIETQKGMLEMWIGFYPPDKRKRDIDNGIKALLDSMEKASVYEDDSQIKKLIVAMHEPVKGGRVDVEITQITHVKDGKVVGPIPEWKQALGAAKGFLGDDKPEDVIRRSRE